MDIKFVVSPKSINPNDFVSGDIRVTYPGRYDGVVVNTQILDSNHHITYTSCNGKKMASNVSRLFIPRDDMVEDRAQFTAEARFERDRTYEIKFRASIIEQHKEIESATVFVSY